MSSTNILLLGQPSTGKTTFTAALWFYVSNWSDGLVLKLDTLAEGDHQYLNKIRDEWAKYSIVPRTLLSDEKNMRILMKLQMPSTQKKLILDIPDFSGEIFKEQFKSREWSLEFDQQLDAITGIILFVSSTDPNPTPKFISHVDELEQILGSTSAKEDHTATNLTEWNHDFAPSQVKIVDSLQSIIGRRKSKKQLKISVVISAWDQVDDYANMNPKNWIENNFPLVDQYLDSNQDLFVAKYFGVSAQGGDYLNEESLNQLIAKKPLERIIMQENEETSSDITKPILWLIS